MSVCWVIIIIIAIVHSPSIRYTVHAVYCILELEMCVCSVVSESSIKKRERQRGREKSREYLLPVVSSSLVFVSANYYY